MKIITDYKNAHDYVRFKIAYNLGLNIRIQESKTIYKKTTEFKLKCILPHRLILTNGKEYEGILEINNLDSFIIKEKKNGIVIQKEPNIKEMDKKLKLEVLKFNENKLKEIKWSGA